jgi:hypothetical protein
MRGSCIFAILTALALAAEKKPAEARAENDRVAVTATLYSSKEAVRQELGAELPGDFIMVKAAVSPKSGQSLAVHRDDFLLRSDKDGQKCQPFAPTQIAGPAALVISQGGRGGGGFMTEDRGPVWGGAPGTGQRPRRLGNEGAVVGNVDAGSTQAGFESGAGRKQDPLLAALRQKALPEKSAAEPVSGLLYFQLEGKHQPKDLELRYDGPAGKLSLRFRP